MLVFMCTYLLHEYSWGLHTKALETKTVTLRDSLVKNPAVILAFNRPWVEIDTKTQISTSLKFRKNIRAWHGVLYQIDARDTQTSESYFPDLQYRKMR